METVSRMLRVVMQILHPLPGIGDLIALIAIVLLLLGVPGAVAASVAYAGADRIATLSWALASLLGLLFALAFIASYRAQERIDVHVAITPRLEFGPLHPSEEVISVPGTPAITASGSTSTAQLPCLLWRIVLSNVVEGTKATNVNVELAETDPHLPVLPVKLHEKHNDVAPYRQLRDIRHGEPVIFDVIAKAAGHDDIFVWRSDLPDGFGYVYTLSPPEHRIIDDKLKSVGITLTLRVIADPPVRVADQLCRLVLDGTGELSMEML